MDKSCFLLNTVKTKEMASDSQRSKPTSQHIREAHWGEHWAQDNWISLRGWIKYWSIYLPIRQSLSVCVSLCLMLGFVGEWWGEGFPNKNNSPNSGIIKSLKDSEEIKLSFSQTSYMFGQKCNKRYVMWKQTKALFNTKFWWDNGFKEENILSIVKDRRKKMILHHENEPKINSVCQISQYIYVLCICGFVISWSAFMTYSFNLEFV